MRTWRPYCSQTFCWMPVKTHNLWAVGAKNTVPERLVRSGLHRLGFRFRLHSPNLPGKPDLHLSKYNLALFVHGCFWHGHDCRLFKWPKTRTEFWKNKIESNKTRDQRQIDQLIEWNIRVGIVWECSLKGKTRFTEEFFFEQLVGYIESDLSFFELSST